ncbi:DUF3108 domain-containing protein [Tistrella bauzanensis]|nr:DUF3108 domain-containing protein [Tistrella bauzanensis]
MFGYQLSRIARSATLLFIMAAGPAFAQNGLDGSFHAPVPSTELVWQGETHSGNYTSHNVFIGVDGFKIMFKRGSVEDGAWIPFCYSCARNVIDMDAYAALWPLEVGKSVSFRRKRADGNREWAHVITVTGTESVTVGAGTFDTFVVEEVATSIGGSWRSTSHFWWAPAVNYMVKQEIEESSGQWSRDQVINIKSR